jgi:flagellar hook-basal body complex protein FliE
MTQITQEKPVLTYNDKQYVIEELPNEARICLVYMQECDQEVERLQKIITKEQVARQGFEKLLGDLLKAVEEAQEQAEKEQEENIKNEKPAN